MPLGNVLERVCVADLEAVVAMTEVEGRYLTAELLQDPLGVVHLPARGLAVVVVGEVGRVAQVAGIRMKFHLTRSFPSLA